MLQEEEGKEEGEGVVGGMGVGVTSLREREEWWEAVVVAVAMEGTVVEGTVVAREWAWRDRRNTG